jgi:hypothetical protein
MRLGVLLVGLVGLSASCGDEGVSLSTFAGTWQGHGRTLTVTNEGQAREQINSSCCEVALRLEFRISRPGGSGNPATALATVTRVQVVDREWFTKSNPAPRVGQTRMIRLRNGVIYEGLTRVYYCRAATWRPQLCGA